MFSLRSIQIYWHTVYLSVDDTIQTESAPPTPVNRTQSRNGNFLKKKLIERKVKFISIISFINLCILQGWMGPDHYEDNGVHLKAISPDKVLSPCRRLPHCPQADDQPVQSSNRRARWQAVTRSRWILWTTGHLPGHRLVDRRMREVSQDDDTARCCILNCVTWCNSRGTGYEYTVCSSLKWDKSHTNVLKVFYTGIFFLSIFAIFRH